MAEETLQAKNQQEKNSNYFDGHWIRKASLWENIMNSATKFGNFLIWYQLNLRSKSPLRGEDVRTTVNHLYRRVPNISACLCPREGTLWVRRATNPEIDFKIFQGHTVEEVRDMLRNHHYSSETGPLFCARLLENSPDKILDLDNLDPDMHYSYYMFFGFHHGVVDGTSNMYVMGFFITMLNDVISGKPINDDQPLGTYFSDDETEKLVTKRREMIEADSSLKETLYREIEEKKNHTSHIATYFPPPTNKRRTVTIDRILDRDTTLKFIQICRQEKVTVHSAFTALANVALVDILVENGILQDSYEIQNFHLVNLRRYWEVQVPNALGFHVSSPLKNYTDTPRNLGENFWDYLHSLHQVLKSHIESGKPLLNSAFETLSSSKIPYSSEEYLLGEKKFEGDFIISNMGDITSRVTEGGEHVRISHVFRSTTIHLIDVPLEIDIHTFRGRLFVMFGYNAAVLRSDIADKFCSQIIKRLRGILE